MKNEDTGNLKVRVKEVRMMKLSELKANPKNWRKHTEEQKLAIQAAMREIGFAGSVLARKAEDGSLVLIDGHLRAEQSPDAVVPVLITDLNEKESEKLLATFDLIGGMAKKGDAEFSSLLEGIEFDELWLRKITDELDNTEEEVEEEKEKDPETEDGRAVALQPFEHHDYIVLLFNSSLDFDAACDKLGVKSVKIPLGAGNKKIGLGRVVDGASAMRKLCES